MAFTSTVISSQVEDIYCLCCSSESGFLNITNSLMVMTDCKLHLRFCINARSAGCTLAESRCHHKTRRGLLSPGLNQNMICTVCLAVHLSRSMSPAFGVACVGSEARLCNAHHPLGSCCPLICCYSGRSLLRTGWRWPERIVSHSR